MTVAKGKFPYFFCLGTQHATNRCRERYVRVDALETAIGTLYEQLRLPDSILADIAQELEHAVEQQRADIIAANTTMRRRLAQLERDHDRAMRAYYADAITADRLRSEQLRIATEQAHARDLLTNADQHLAHLDLIVDRALDHARDLHATYQNGNGTVQRMLNHSVFANITVADRTIVNVTYQPQFRCTKRHRRTR